MPPRPGRLAPAPDMPPIPPGIAGRVAALGSEGRDMFGMPAPGRWKLGPCPIPMPPAGRDIPAPGLGRDMCGMFGRCMLGMLGRDICGALGRCMFGMLGRDICGACGRAPPPPTRPIEGRGPPPPPRPGEASAPPGNAMTAVASTRIGPRLPHNDVKRFMSADSPRMSTLAEPSPPRPQADGRADTLYGRRRDRFTAPPASRAPEQRAHRAESSCRAQPCRRKPVSPPAVPPRAEQAADGRF